MHLTTDEDRHDWWLTLLKLKRDIVEEKDLKLRKRWVNAYNWALETYIENSPGRRSQQLKQSN